MKMNKIVALGLLLILVGVALPLLGISAPSPVGASLLKFSIVSTKTFDFVTDFSRADSVTIPEHGCWLTFDTRLFQVNPATDDVVHVLVRDDNYQNVAGTTVNVYVTGTDQLVDTGVTDTNGQVNFALGTSGDGGSQLQTMSFTSSAQGSGTINPSGTASHNVGDMVTFTATPAAGYVVDFWTLSSSPTLDGSVLADAGTRATIRVQMIALYNGYTLTVHFRKSDAPPTPHFEWLQLFNYVTIAGVIMVAGGYALDKRKKK